ncbi:hypothetical protein [Streptomyces anulatus]|uniref:hypothetical protein n=1 Tax=Streptomyces anulatus TaxID=1892 RepID=UPI001D18FD6E|nr:hypothetical protein [Streptomyces anulatus]
MTNDETSEGEWVRPFAVPINIHFAREAADTLREYREMVADGLDNVGVPSTDSPIRSEMAWMQGIPDPVGSARGSLHGMLLEVVGMSWDTAVDHVRALEHDIIRTPAPVWSPLVIARAVLESCLLVDYLFESPLSGATRLARCAGLWRKDTDYSANFAKVLDQDQAATDLDAYVMAALDECGIQARRNASGKITGYEVDGEHSNLDYNITGRTRERLPTWLPMPYGLLSGAAHGRPWMTDRARSLAGEGADLVGEAATVMTALMVGMASLEMGLKSWQRYFGFDLDQVIEEMEQYRELMSLRLMGFAHRSDE